MNTFELRSEIEGQLIQIEYARAILAELDDYFTHTEESKYLPRYANHIQKLIHVTDQLILSTIAPLESVVKLMVPVKEGQVNG